MTIRFPALLSLVLLLPLAGCYSPYHADRGALFGGLLGAGTGAVVGHALGNTGAGAAIGAGVGALSGAAIGAGMDETEARNRAYIEQRLGRQMAGQVTVQDVVQMTRAGLDPEIVVNHIRVHGVASPLQPPDLIYLQQQGVSTRVIETMQAVAAQPPAPVVAAAPVYPEPAPPAVIIEERWGPGWYHRPYHHYW